eukprot:scaffold39011_cov33-Phaeocystis_antarctica.AAC.1
MDDEVRSSAGGGDVSGDVGGGGGGGGGGDQRRAWGVPRRSGPGVRRRDSLSMETQAAVAEAAVEEAAVAAAAEAAAAVVAVVASGAMGGPEVPSLPLRNTGGRDTLPGPVAAQIQMHGLMLMQHWSSLTSMESERSSTQSRMASPRPSQSPRSLGDMAR